MPVFVVPVIPESRSLGSCVVSSENDMFIALVYYNAKCSAKLYSYITLLRVYVLPFAYMHTQRRINGYKSLFHFKGLFCYDLLHYNYYVTR